MAAAAWFNAPTDVEAYRRLAAAVGEWNAYCAPTMEPMMISGGGALADPGTTSSDSSFERSGGPGGSGPGHDHTPVTGDELADVTAAVEAYDSAVTVESVRKDPDGSYDVLGTKDDAPVSLEVSADLETVTERAGEPGGPRGDGDHGPHPGDTIPNGTAPTESGSSDSSTRSDGASSGSTTSADHAA